MANYDLSVENPSTISRKLDISLFERLCFRGVPSTSHERFHYPVAILGVQRRMRSEIADLVRSTLYKNLEDHSSVEDYPRVPGILHNVYWLDHAHRENGSSEFDAKETSHSNDFEVEMVTQLVSHLSKQEGYSSGDIAVLTPYLGQLRSLRDALGSQYCIELSEKDDEEATALDSLESLITTALDHQARRPLSQTLRIATVTPSHVPTKSL